MDANTKTIVKETLSQIAEGVRCSKQTTGKGTIVYFNLQRHDSTINFSIDLSFEANITGQTESIE
jgi:hypothetical protein